jgi:hypothetical protein
VVSRLKEPWIYDDPTTPAFGIRIGKNRKAWVITKGNDRQRITIGRYPSMTSAEARKDTPGMTLLSWRNMTALFRAARSSMTRSLAAP